MFIECVKHSFFRFFVRCAIFKYSVFVSVCMGAISSLQPVVDRVPSTTYLTVAGYVKKHGNYHCLNSVLCDPIYFYER